MVSWRVIKDWKMAQDTIKSSKDAEEELVRDGLLNYDYQLSLWFKAALYKALAESLNLQYTGNGRCTTACI